jgi:hypothetical protein
MPFKSEKQRRYMFANHPKIARKWSRYGDSPVRKSSRRRSSPSRRKRKRRKRSPSRRRRRSRVSGGRKRKRRSRSRSPSRRRRRSRVSGGKKKKNACFDLHINSLVECVKKKSKGRKLTREEELVLEDLFAIDVREAGKLLLQKHFEERDDSEYE